MLIAGCHVLHRLLVPRHPPDALLTLENPCTGASPQCIDDQLQQKGLLNFEEFLLALPTRILDGDVANSSISNGSYIIRPRLPYSRCKTARRKIGPKDRSYTVDPEDRTGWIFPQISDEMVEANGIEPMTYGLQSRRSPS